MFSLEIDKMTALRQNDILTFIFMSHSQISYQTEQLLQNKFFNSIFTLESDEMTALRPIDNLTFTFCMTFSKKHTKLNNFCKKSFSIPCLL